MTVSAECLMVATIPEQFHVATVRDDVVNYMRSGVTSHATRMLVQERDTVLLPLAIITARASTWPTCIVLTLTLYLARARCSRSNAVAAGADTIGANRHGHFRSGREMDVPLWLTNTSIPTADTTTQHVGRSVITAVGWLSARWPDGLGPTCLRGTDSCCRRA